MTATSAQSAWHPLPERLRALAAGSRSSVLLESARASRTEAQSLLFVNPVRELVAYTPDELQPLLEQVDRYVEAGAYVAGYFAYECGELFMGLEPHAANVQSGRPLAWLGVYDQVLRFDHHAAPAEPEIIPADPAPRDVLISQGLQITPEAYSLAIDRVQHYLQAGHSYQVNFTDRVTGWLTESPAAVYRALLERQPVSFAAMVQHPAGTLLSFSPELFYRTAGGRITVRPMKGTWPLDSEGDDESAAQALRADAKNRSEHVTIVDLLRNDIGRIATAGSVQVEQLFAVEHYETLLQMTSTISATLQPQLSPTDIFKSLFPSGSITGAPKRRTMEIIRELEAQPRGAYTGAIGYFAPGGEACFNVAIRTLTLAGSDFTMGVGGGITLDSMAAQEYDECRLKSAFLTGAPQPFALLETMRAEHGCIALLDQHLERLTRSAGHFKIGYDHACLRAELVAAGACWTDGPARVRLTLGADSRWQIVATALDQPAWSGRVLLSAERTRSADILLHHKSTYRHFYDSRIAAARVAGFAEVLFRNERGDVTEGAISNVFALLDGHWVTPALNCGVLPGIGRALAWKELRADERDVTLDDLLRSQRLMVVSALRGRREVLELYAPNGRVLWRTRSTQMAGDAAK